MKLQTYAAFAVLCSLLSLSAACSKSATDTQKSAANPVDQLITLCKNKNYKEAIKHVIDRNKCRGKDSPVDCIADYDAMSGDEKQRVERDCERMVLTYREYKVGPEKELKDKGPIIGYEYEVDFLGKDMGKDKPMKSKWIFVKVGADYALYDID